MGTVELPGLCRTKGESGRGGGNGEDSFVVEPKNVLDRNSRSVGGRCGEGAVEARKDGQEND